MENIFVWVALALLAWIAWILERISMDTSALKVAFGQFSTDFSKFAADVAAFVAAQVPQDTPEQIADVKAVTDGLTAFDAQVQALDKLVNPAPVV